MKSLEKEFLKLAGFMLYSRWKLLGHDVESDVHLHVSASNTLQMALLGYIDYSLEMELTLNEFKRLRK